MTKSEISNAWFKVMAEKYSTDEEGVREIMRSRQKKSMQSPKRKQPGHHGGFQSMDKARLKEISQKGLASRQAKSYNKANEDDVA